YSLMLYVIRHKVKPLVETFMNIVKVLLFNKIMVIASVIDRLGIGRSSRNAKGGSNNDDDYDDNMLVLNFNPVRLRLRLLTRDGRAVANRLARIYVDDIMLASITSDHNGELDVMLTLKDTMKTLLSVYVDGYSRPLLEKVIMVRSTRY
ncbi:MAG: hypothetical protein QXE03_04640, partial [Candidatus Nitrosocaldus sp.]